MIVLTGHIRKYQISFWTKHGNSKNFWNIVIWKLYQSLGGPLSVQTWEAIWSNMCYFFVLVVLCLKLRGSNTQHMRTCTELQQPKQTTHFRSQEENFPLDLKSVQWLWMTQIFLHCCWLAGWAHAVQPGALWMISITQPSDAAAARSDS